MKNRCWKRYETDSHPFLKIIKREPALLMGKQKTIKFTHAHKRTYMYVYDYTCRHICVCMRV